MQSLRILSAHEADCLEGLQSPMYLEDSIKKNFEAYQKEKTAYRKQMVSTEYILYSDNRIQLANGLRITQGTHSLRNSNQHYVKFSDVQITRF